MRQWGYDSKSKFLFSWDKEFRFEGKVSDAPDVVSGVKVHIVEDGNRDGFELAGCMFLSGWRGNCLALRVDDSEDVGGFVGMFRGRARTVRGRLDSMASLAVPSSPVLMCGPAVKDPARVAQFCKVFPLKTVYVCPIVDELAAFGALVLGLEKEERPRKANLFVPNTEPMMGEAVEFDAKLDGDGYGKMAYAVANGTRVLNEMMCGPGVPRFYGQVVSNGLGVCETYVVRMRAMEDFFPTEVIAAREYAAACVPVRMANTEKFSVATKCQAKTVDVLVISDMIAELPTFARFYNVMTGRSVFGVDTPKDIAEARLRMPVWRGNKGYRIC